MGGARLYFELMTLMRSSDSRVRAEEDTVLVIDGCGYGTCAAGKTCASIKLSQSETISFSLKYRRHYTFLCYTVPRCKKTNDRVL